MHLMRRAIVGFAALMLGACQPSGSNDAPADVGDITRWESILADDISPAEGVSYTQVSVDGSTVAQISNVPADAPSTNRTGGVSVRMPPAFEALASGARVQIVVRASSTENGAVLGVAYSTAEVGNSGWQRFLLSTTPRDYVFAYNVPAGGNADNGDYLGFRSYNDGVVQIFGYNVEVVPTERAPSPPPAAAPAP